MKQISQLAAGVLIVLISATTLASSKSAPKAAVDLVKANNSSNVFEGKASALDALKSLRRGLPNEEARKVPVKVVVDAVKAAGKATGTLEQFLIYHPGMTDAAIQATIGSSDNSQLASSLMSAVVKRSGESSRFSLDESDTSMQTIGSIVEFMTNGTANAEQAAFARDLVEILTKQPTLALDDSLKAVGGKYFTPKPGVMDLATWLRLLCECTGRCKG